MNSRLRVMFVDDEPLVLQGLQRTLRPLRNEWEMEFRQSGAAALERMAEVPFDVVVSDMLMPGMSGADLLNKVTELYPRTVRLILSGHADQNLILKCVANTHQFLAKPCEPDALKTVITRATSRNMQLENEKLRSVIARMTRLPSFPSLYAELTRALQDPEVSMEVVGKIVARDVAMTASVLKLVNSAFFGLRRQISNPEEAASYLGVEVLKSLVLAVHAFCEESDPKCSDLCVEGLWRHSLSVGAGAKLIAQMEDADLPIVHESLTAGMLHDVGRLVLVMNFPDECRQVNETARAGAISLFEAEHQVFGSSHAEVGGYLLGLWGLPAPVVEAVSFHHTPQRSASRSFTALTAVHVAEAALEHRDGPPPAFDAAYLAETGLAHRLPVWESAMQEAPKDSL